MSDKPNYLVILLAGGLILVVAMSLCNTALNSVAGVANAIAMAEMANAVQVSQYTILLLVLALVAVPVVIAVIVWRLTANATRQPQYLPQPQSNYYLPGRIQRAMPPPVESIDAETAEFIELAELWSQSNERQHAHRR